MRMEEEMGSLKQFLHRREHHDGDGTHVGLAVRSHVVLHHAELDRDLAAGIAPQTSPEHACRAGQLLGRHVRLGLAGCIDGVIARAEHPPHWHSTALPIEAAGIRAARIELERLREALLDDACRSVRGVARAAILLQDEQSPIHTALADSTVAESARAAVEALAANADSRSAGV